MNPELSRSIERLIVVATCPLLIFIGYRLFVLGVTGEMKIAANLDRFSGKLSTVAPGGVCFVLGVALGAYVLARAYTHEKTTVLPVKGDSVSVREKTSFLGGSVSGLPLSVALRAALGDRYLCEQTYSATDPQRCVTEYERFFSDVPSASDLARIALIETELRTNPTDGAATQYNTMRATFERR
jgi:hypothetical protein